MHHQQEQSLYHTVRKIINKKFLEKLIDSFDLLCKLKVLQIDISAYMNITCSREGTNRSHCIGG